MQALQSDIDIGHTVFLNLGSMQAMTARPVERRSCAQMLRCRRTAR